MFQLHATKTSASANGTKSNGNKRVNPQVRSIMSILEERYDLPPLSDDVVDNKSKIIEWKKTRNYLYHVSRSHQPVSHDDDDDILTLQQQVVTVLDFLDERLELPPHVPKQILQESPRLASFENRWIA